MLFRGAERRDNVSLMAISWTSQRRRSLYAGVQSKSPKRRFHGDAAIHVFSIVVVWLTASACSEATRRGDRTTEKNRTTAPQRPVPPQIATRLATTLSDGRTVFWPIRHSGHVACRQWKVRQIKGYKNQGRLIHSFDNFGERGEQQLRYQIDGSGIVLRNPRLVLEPTDDNGCTSTEHPSRCKKGKAGPARRKDAVSKRRVLGITKTSMQFARGYWYFNKSQCDAATKRGNRKPFSLLELILPEPSVPRWCADPKRDWLRSRLQSGSPVWFVVERRGKKICEVWRFYPGASPNRGAIERRFPAAPHLKNQGYAYRRGFTYYGKVMVLLGPATFFYGRTKLRGGVASGCASFLPVNAVTQSFARVGRAIWHFNRRSCLNGLNKENGKISPAYAPDFF